MTAKQAVWSAGGAAKARIVALSSGGANAVRYPRAVQSAVTQTIAETADIACLELTIQSHE